ncbi:MAG: 4'-phosphopantetheinyl transferase superfamily protein [Clostridiales bacterium]|nr:4'-phosphopantetheinyl transferase superfamily protein [Clostridiales bacterium]
MKIYTSDITQMNDLPGSGLLTQARRERMLRYYQLSDQARCLVAGLMLRKVLGEEQAQRIAATALGKPYLPGGPHFSLSHSGSKVVLLVDAQEAGVDVEQIAPYPEIVARRVFTLREQAWLKKQKGHEAFYRLWTGKESIMKALGQGFHLPPESFEILPDSAGPNWVQGEAWYLKWQNLDNHMLCCASSIPDAQPEMIHLSREVLLE